MAKMKAVFDLNAGSKNINIRIDNDLYDEYQEVKKLLKDSGIGKLNMTESLRPSIELILEDAREKAEKILSKNNINNGEKLIV